jgi:AcrR family transcriptional regulator
MSWSKDGRGDRDAPRAYHHGNLREALIAAALELIASKGIAGFTFAEAARFAGVSPGAPYRHFRDRDELMASVALRGFEKFEAVLTHAWNGGRPDAFSALDRLGKAYLEFARGQPAFYSAMFEGGIPVGNDPALREAGERAFAVLRGAADQISAAMPAASRPPALMVALHIWAMAHGVASLFARGDGGQRATPMSPAELLEAHMLVYLRGLGARS